MKIAEIIINRGGIFVISFYLMSLLSEPTCGISFDITKLFDVLEVPENIDIIITSDSRRLMDSSALTERILHDMDTISIHTDRLLNPYKLNKSRDFISEALNIFLPTNTTSVFNFLEQIINYLTQNSLTNLHWNPRFLIIWPIVLENKLIAQQTFANESFDPYIGYLSIKSEVYIVMPYKSESKVELTFWEVYSLSNISFRNEFQLNPRNAMGNWYNLASISRRRNFRGAEITACAGNDEVYYLESKFTKDLTRFDSGSAVRRFWYIRDGLNFTERAILADWTSEDENGHLTGGGLEVMEGKIDLSISQTPVTSSKRKHIDFLQPTDHRQLKTFFVQPPSSHHRDMYMATFEPHLWVSIFTVWFILSFAMCLIIWLESAFTKVVHEDNWIVNECCIWAIGTAAQKGWYNKPKSIPIRIVHLLGHLTGLLCFTAFTASIVSFLSVKSTPIKTFSDILSHSFRILANSNSTPILYVLPILQAQKGYPDQIIVNEIVSIPKASSSTTAVVAFAYVFYIEARQQNWTDQNLCKTFDSRPVLNVPLRGGMFVKKGSPLKEFFNHQIILMKEGGFNFRIESTYTRDTEASCLTDMIGQHESLGIQDVISAPVILLMGLFLSLGFLVLERCIYWKLIHWNSVLTF